MAVKKKLMHLHPLPMDPTPQHQKLLEMSPSMSSDEIVLAEKEFSFTYCQAVGEIIFTMVTCSPDISYPIIKLSQYCTKPACIHFEALKRLHQYLKATKDHGIFYWRKQPCNDLPKGNIPTLVHSNNYTESRQSLQQTILQLFVDSDHASNSLHRRSVSGFHCQSVGGVVQYKTQVQPIVAQSSTKAEFIVALEAGKSILYLRTIM